MPIPLAVKGAAVAVSIAAATALALYENPELRRYADDLRRRIAMALHAAGNGLDPPLREPLFNRPEDAQGFVQSRAENGVDADEESRRRQREELLYWNSIRLQKDEADKDEAQKRHARSSVGATKASSPASTFDDFLKPDGTREQGAYVYNTGTQTVADSQNLVRRRQMSSAPYANPFADEQHLDMAEVMRPTAEETISDIYSVTTVDRDEPRTPTAEQSLVELDYPPAPPTESSATVDHDEYMTASQDDREEAYASVQAWAESQSQPQRPAASDFYSPLPTTPAAPASEAEAELASDDGQLTPADSASLAGSGEDVADDVRSMQDPNSTARQFDVLSVSDAMTTSSWSEIDTVSSDGEAPIPAHAS